MCNFRRCFSIVGALCARYLCGRRSTQNTPHSTPHNRSTTRSCSRRRRSSFRFRFRARTHSTIRRVFRVSRVSGRSGCVATVAAVWQLFVGTLPRAAASLLKEPKRNRWFNRAGMCLYAWIYLSTIYLRTFQLVFVSIQHHTHISDDVQHYSHECQLCVYVCVTVFESFLMCECVFECASLFKLRNLQAIISLFCG